MKKPVYLGMSILDISKTLMYEFQYDYIKPKYQWSCTQDRAKICYMDTDSFVIYIKTEDFYEGIADGVKKWFDTSNCGEDDKRLLPIGESKKVIGFFKDKLGGKIMKKFVGLRAKTWAFLMDDDTEHKKPKRTKKGVIKRKLMCKNYKDCLFNDETILKSQQRFKSHYHNVYTERINKITLSSNDDKKLQTSDKITTYSYGTNTYTT